MPYTHLPSQQTIEKTVAALRANGMEVFVVQNGEEAKRKVLELLPEGASVMTMTSVTLDSIGVTQEILESGRYDAVHKRVLSMDRATQAAEIRRLRSAPEWAIGSAHAVTEDGKVMIASQTGSQLPAYAYGAEKVIWVVGAQKIVKDVDEGFRRIYEHSLPLESERARKAYGSPGSGANKVLIVSREAQSGRIIVVLINEAVGY